jgi:hypothetical protein
MFDVNEYSFDPTSGASTGSKILDPGTHIVRVLDMYLEPAPYDEQVYNLILFLEGEPGGPEFQGLMVDKDRPDLGCYLGPVGRVKASKYAFKTAVYPNRTIDRDKSIFGWVNDFAFRIGKLDTIKKNSTPKATIEEYITFVKKYICDLSWIEVNVGGRKYLKNNGYFGMDLNFPNPENGLFPFTVLNDPEKKHFLPHNPEKHVEQPHVKTPIVDTFGGQDNTSLLTMPDEGFKGLSEEGGKPGDLMRF